MGREALVHAEVGDQVGEVRALLESDALILRGDIRRRYPRATIERLVVEAGWLRFRAVGETVALQLGDDSARRWAAAMIKPLPSLRDKLGLQVGSRVLLLGQVTDDALQTALSGSVTTDIASAHAIIAMITGPETLSKAVEAGLAQAKLPVWAVYSKGRGVPVGATAIRLAMRGAGLMDNKTCAVSDRLTATRYAHPRLTSGA